MRSPSGVLHDRRTSRREVTLGAVAEPSGSRGDVRVLRDAELRARLLNEGAVIPERARHTHRVHRAPAVLAQQLLRSVDGELKRLRCLRRQIDEADELLILVAADVGEAFDLPGHHAGEVAAGRDGRAPVVEGHRLPGFVPRELAGRNRGRSRADVRAERKEMIELLKKLHVPRLGLRDCQLRERGVGIDERLSRNPRVLVAPEPRSAGEIQKQIRVGAERADVVRAFAVVGSVVVDERPSITEAEWFKRAVNVGSPVRGISRARVLDRVVHAFACVFDVEHVVAERAQAEQIHQRAPGDAAKWVAGNDPCKEDLHGRKGRTGWAGRIVIVWRLR